MKTPVFFQYHKDNLLDKLLDLFKGHGWIIEGPVNELKKYHWPDIVLSEKKSPKKLDGYDIELMGAYILPNDCEKIEGQVYLYIPTILKVADDYVKEHSIAPDKLMEVFEQLTEIVLVHEFMHFIMHFIECKKVEKNNNETTKLCPFHYDNIDQINFHEGFAQLFTYYLIKIRPELLSIFEWLEKGQSSQYKVFREVEKYGVELSTKVLGVLKEMNVQSWEFTKILYDDKGIVTEVLVLYFGNNGNVNLQGNKFADYVCENKQDLYVDLRGCFISGSYGV